MKKSVLSLGVLTAAAALVLTGCSSAGESTVADDCEPTTGVETVKDGVLSVALTNTPPYSLEEDGDIAGIDSLMIKEFAAAECLEIEFAPYTYATAIPAIEQARVDVALGGFYRTQARADVVTLSTPLYLDELSVYSEEGYATVDELLGKTIGTVEGYLWVDDLKNLPGTETRVYPDSLSLAQDLKAGRLDAALDGYGAAVVATQGEDYTIEVLQEDERVQSTSVPSQTAVLFDPANTELSDAFNVLAEEMREDGRLVEYLAEYGLPASAAEVGEERLI
ncbi:substrate-binding periplasmic protein [Salinibacterium sp. GXW1014]|uniref:substrate-binding periplasmic protein n=1 Tax=Salinibacterium sp. GXW1014 TaxID=3377838 RepID=UPI00383BA2EA